MKNSASRNKPTQLEFSSTPPLFLFRRPGFQGEVMTSSARWFFLFLATFLGARQAFSLTRTSFLNLLLALALIFGTLSLLLPAPAQAQPAWSATLTVAAASDSLSAVGGMGCGRTGSSTCNMQLTDNSFTLGSTTYSFFTILEESNGDILMAFDKAKNSELQALKFCVGTRAFDIPDNAGIGARFRGASVGWSVGDTVELSIGSSCPEPPMDDPPTTDDPDEDTEEPPTPEFTLSASPDPVPWDGAGAITVTVKWPTAQDSESAVVHIVEDGLCSWDHFRGNQAIVNIPGGQKVNFNLARHEGYYNGEDCNKENKEDCKKCFFTWDASWATGTARGVLVLSILPPPGTGGPVQPRQPSPGPPSGPPTGGGPPPPAVPSDPTPDSDTPARCGESDREYLKSFYRATEGDAWDRNENWNSEEPLDQWFGVKTDEDGEVISLRLADNNLSRDMPTEELRCLNENTELKELALWGNDDLSGEVPDKLVLAVERAALRDVAVALSLNTQWFEDYEEPFKFSDWHEGVTTDDEGRVTGLDFTEEDIEGEIPQSVFELKRLTAIETGCEVTLEVEAPGRVSVMMPDDCAEETVSSGDGGCALGQGDSSVPGFGLFLVTLLVFATLGRKKCV